MELDAVLEAGRQDFLDAVRGLPESVAAAKPGSGGWSVLECAEHVVTVEERYLGWLRNGPAVEPRRNYDRELRLLGMMRSRLRKVQAPEAVRPAGRFPTLAEAVSAFGVARERTIAFVREKGNGLCAIGAEHPFFGKVNGTELVQLMDGHARRHSEQIRETREGLSGPGKERRNKPVSAKKAAGFRRDRPDLPGELEPAVSLESEDDLVTLQERRLADVSCAGLRADALRLEGSLLERVSLAGGQFGSAVWKDVRLEGCDLANVRAHRMTLVRVELVDCRMTGFIATALDWTDVLVRNVDMDFAQLAGGKFRNCEFDGCQWQEADLQNADLAGCVVRSCRLGRADLRGARLQGADLRKSEVEGLVVGMNDVRGAIVDAPQAMVLARLMGLEIR